MRSPRELLVNQSEGSAWAPFTQLFMLPVWESNFCHRSESWHFDLTLLGRGKAGRKVIPSERQQEGAILSLLHVSSESIHWLQAGVHFQRGRGIRLLLSRSCNSYHAPSASLLPKVPDFWVADILSLASSDTGTFGLFITSHSRVYTCGNPPFPPPNQQLWLNPGRKGWEVCEYIAHQWLRSQNFREKISDEFF